MSTKETKQLVIPLTKGGNLVLDLSSVEVIESRIDEVRRSNPLTFPDLVVDFNIGMTRLGNMIGQVELELENAKQELKMSEAIALLERVEDRIKARGMKSSTDTRQAELDIDPDVIKARNQVSLIKSILAFLQNKYSSLERAYFSSKTVCDVQMTPLGTNFGGRK